MPGNDVIGTGSAWIVVRGSLSSATPFFHGNLKGVNLVARVTIEDCLNKVPNRFSLVLLTTSRAKQLLKRATLLLESDNREIVLTLREIAEGKVGVVGKELTVVPINLNTAVGDKPDQKRRVITSY